MCSNVTTPKSLAGAKNPVARAKYMNEKANESRADREVPAEEQVKEVVQEEVKQPVVAPTDVGNGQDNTAEDNNKQRKKRGYAATRVANDRVVLTDSAPVSGGRQTLG